MKQPFCSAQVRTLDRMLTSPVRYTSCIEMFVYLLAPPNYFLSGYCPLLARVVYATFSLHMASSNICGELASGGNTV